MQLARLTRSQSRLLRVFEVGCLASSSAMICPIPKLTMQVVKIGLAAGGMRVEWWVASPEPALGLFTPAGRKGGKGARDGGEGADGARCDLPCPPRSPRPRETARDARDARCMAHNPEVAGSNPAPATKVEALFRTGRGPLACGLLTDSPTRPRFTPSRLRCRRPPFSG